MFGLPYVKSPRSVVTLFGGILVVLAAFAMLGFGLAFASLGASAAAPTGVASNAQYAPVATCTPGSDYSITTSTGAVIVPGTTDTGNHCDDCPSTIALPFQYSFYDVSYNSVTATSNGTLQFSSANTAFNNTCLPTSVMNNAIFAHWDDLITNQQLGCSAFPGGCGVFTSVSGAAPNRIFNIEWRAVYLVDGTTVNFEVRLYEGQN